MRSYSVGDIVAVRVSDRPSKHDGFNTAFFRIGIATDSEDGYVTEVQFIFDDAPTVRQYYDGHALMGTDKPLDKEALISAVRERGDDRFFALDEVTEFYRGFLLEEAA